MSIQALTPNRTKRAPKNAARLDDAKVPKGFSTRTREFRKLRGMTLKELADKINTTPQTMQRLETDNMTISVSWIFQIARALAVEPADLLGTRSSREIPLLGRIGDHGRLGRVGREQNSIIHLDVPAYNPVAARLDTSAGYFEAGSILIATRFRAEDLDNAHAQDCLVAVKDGTILLRRLIRGRDHGWTLVPHENGTEIQYDQAIDWAARIVMSIRYF